MAQTASFMIGKARVIVSNKLLFSFGFDFAKARDMLIKILPKIKHLAYFSEMNFIISRTVFFNRPGTKQAVTRTYMRNGRVIKIVIFLNTTAFEDETRLLRVLAHELAHAVSNSTNLYRWIRITTEKKAFNSYKGLLATLKSGKIMLTVPFLRKKLFYLVDYVVSEGVAMVADELAAFGKFKPVPRRLAENIAEDLNYTFMHGLLFNSRSIVNKFGHAVGYYLIRDIMTAIPKIRLETIMEMDAYAVIRLHENACTRLGLQPLISITSGRGILDYNKILRLWDKKKFMPGFRL